MVFWAHVRDRKSCMSVGKVDLVRWCRLDADREDCLCDRQIVEFDSICKLQWDDFFEDFLFSVDTVLHYGPNAKRQHVMQVYPRCLSDKKEFGVLDMRIIVFLLTIFSLRQRFSNFISLRHTITNTRFGRGTPTL